MLTGVRPPYGQNGLETHKSPNTKGGGGTRAIRCRLPDHILARFSNIQLIIFVVIGEEQTKFKMTASNLNSIMRLYYK